MAEEPEGGTMFPQPAPPTKGSRKARVGADVVSETVPDAPRRNRAKELLQRKTIRDAQLKIEQIERDKEETAYFLICPRVGWDPKSRTGHVAAWLTEKPSNSGRIHPGMWESLHHEVGTPWTEPFIPCQECFVEGEARVWSPHVRPIRRSDGSYDFIMSAERKYVVGSVSKEELGIRREQLEEAVGVQREEA